MKKDNWLYGLKESTKNEIIQVISEHEGIQQDKVLAYMKIRNMEKKGIMLLKFKDYFTKVGLEHNLSLSEISGYLTLAITDMILDSKLKANENIKKFKKSMNKERKNGK